MARELVKTPTLLCVTLFTHAPGTTLNMHGIQVAVYMSRSEDSTLRMLDMPTHVAILN